MYAARLIRRTLPLLLALALLPSAPYARAAEAWDVPGVPAVLSQAVEFRHGGATLHGTLYRPTLPGRLPAVVAFHSAGVGNADAALYRHLRQGLPQMGFAVLLFDRRGTGASPSSLTNVSYETLAGDGVAGARAIAKLPFVDGRRIGYWGLSQGGWLAILAADEDRAAAFAVSVSAPLVTPESQMEFAMSNRLRLDGYGSADVNAMLAARKAWTGYLRGTVSRGAAVQGLAAIDTKPWFDTMYMPSASQLTHDPSASSWRKQMDDDLIAAAKAATVPCLFVYGSRDPWIPVRQTVAALSHLTAGHPNLQYAVVAGANHEMMLGQRETMDVSQKRLQRDAPQAPAYFMLLGSWLATHVKSASGSRQTP